ncbi:MAG: Ig-like domain-containing protein [Deltaproteobacteria bacterium]|nr:Ig-like domain-containing protein [Deltaproteobacteria bacterium]
MASNASTAGSGAENQAVGKVFIQYGTAKAVAADGTERALAPNSPIFAHDQIITDSDGSVSIMIDGHDGAPATQLDLGRMSHVTIDEDVYAGAAPGLTADATAEADKIQQALLAGDQPIDLDATAAGGDAGAGGGVTSPFSLSLTGTEGQVGSGAGTTGTEFGTSGTIQGAFTAPTETPINANLTLSAPTAVTENEPGVTFTVHLDNPAQSAATVAVQVGETTYNVEIAAGSSTGTLFIATAHPDAYVDPRSVTATVTGVTGGSFTGVDFSTAQATTAITDVTDTTVAHITTSNVTENAAGVTFSIHLDNAPQGAATVDVQLHDTFTNTTTIQTVAIDAQGNGTLFYASAHPDAYADGSSVTATVTAVSGGNYEATSVVSATATAQVTDVNVDGHDTTVAHITTSNVTENAAGVTFSVHLDNAPQGAATVDVQVHDSFTNATSIQTVAIDAQGNGSFSIATEHPDVYTDPSTVTATVLDIHGGNYEATSVAGATATAQVADVTDTTTVTLDNVTVTEGGNIVYTAHVDHAPQGDLHITLDDTAHTSITIQAGQLSGASEPVIAQNAPDGDAHLTVGITGAQGGNYEHLDTTNTMHLTIIDTVPHANPDIGTVVEGQILTVGLTAGVLANDTASADGITVDAGTFTNGTAGGTLVLAADGSYTYAAPAHVDNTNGAVSDTFTYTVHDADGSTSQSTLTIAIADTGVTAVADVNAVTEHQTATVGGNVITTGPGADTLGADAVHVTLVNGETVAATGTTTIEGSLHGSLVIGANGAYTYTAPVSVNNLIDGVNQPAHEVFTYTITDADGSTSQSTLTIAIGDTGPTAITPDYAYLTNNLGQNQMGTVYLDTDHNVDNNYGNDLNGTVKFAATNGSDSGVTAATAHVYLYTDGSHLIGSTLANSNYATALATTAAKVFDATLNPDYSITTASDTYSFHLYQQIDGGIGTFSVNDVGFQFHGGNQPYAYFDNPTAGASDVLLTPMEKVDGTLISSGTLNTTATAGGVSGGVSVGNGEAMRVDYVINLTGDSTKNVSSANYSITANQDHHFDGHSHVNGATAEFTGISGSSGILIKAFTDPDGNNTVGESTNAHENIKSVFISYNGESKVTSVIDGETGGHNVTVGGHVFHVADSGADALLTGVVDHTTIGTLTDHGYTTLEYDYASGATFKLGSFGATEFTPGDAHELKFDLAVTDGDGSTVPSAMHVFLSPDDHIIQIADDTHHTLTVATGTAGTLVGTDGTDILTGAGGNDILIGGHGHDTLTGHAGADTFIFREAGATNVDHIVDFKSSEGDKIDLSSLTANDTNVHVTHDAVANTTTVSVDSAEVAVLEGYTGSVDILLGDVTHHHT